MEMRTKHASVYAYDANINLERAFSWSLFELGCHKFYNAFVQHSVRALNVAQCQADYTAASKHALHDLHKLRSRRHPCKERMFLISLLQAPHLLLIQVLLNLSRMDKDAQTLQNVAGLLFIATPHFADSPSLRTDILGITQYIHPSKKVPDASRNIAESDLDKLADHSTRFEALKLTCRVLSLYEQVEVVYRAMVFFKSRPVRVSKRS